MAKTTSITTRFVQAMHQIITNNKMHGGKIRSVKDFAESIGYSSSNFSKFSGKSNRSVTIEMIEAICKSYDVNPTWLILGTGTMFRKDSMEAEKLIEKIRKLLK